MVLRTVFFQFLSETASMYKVDQLYHKESERGIHYDDPKLLIGSGPSSFWKDVILPSLVIGGNFERGEMFKV
jgi:hypothetical protein